MLSQPTAARTVPTLQLWSRLAPPPLALQLLPTTMMGRRGAEQGQPRARDRARAFSQHGRGSRHRRRSVALDPGPCASLDDRPWPRPSGARGDAPNHPTCPGCDGPGRPCPTRPGCAPVAYPDLARDLCESYSPISTGCGDAATRGLPLWLDGPPMPAFERRESRRPSSASSASSAEIARSVVSSRRSSIPPSTEGPRFHAICTTCAGLGLQQPLQQVT